MEQTDTSKGQRYNYSGKIWQPNINIVLIFLLVSTYMEQKPLIKATKHTSNS